jgi:integrase
MPATTDMSAPSPTLADLIVAVQGADLTDVQKRDRVSAIRTAARALVAEPGDLPLNIKLLRRRLEEVSPVAIGMTQARWNNVRSLFNRALELKAPIMASTQTASISPAWRDLARVLDRPSQLRLGVLLRFLSGRGVEPEQVMLTDLEGFRDEIIENRLRSTPEKTWDGIVWTWNKCSEATVGWPNVLIPREDRRTVYVRPWSDFPASLKADVDAYLKVLSGEVLDEDGPLKALRPSTLKSRAHQARAAASALVMAGAPADEIRSLADVARLEPIKVILNHVLSRGEGGHKAGAFNIANFLKAAAEHWVKVDEAELTKIRKIVSKLSPGQKGLTEKNRRRLMPFNDSEVVRNFLQVPDGLASEVRRDGRKTVVNAVNAQLAVAIAILQAVPIRIKNLASLDLGRHIFDQNGRVFVRIEADEVKNDRHYQMELPKDVADLIAWYCLTYRDLLIEAPTTALFPGENGKPKSPGTLGRQISERIEQRLGLEVNPHLFRHIAAKLYLDRHPGEYGLVSRLLNHASVSTTMAAYTGAETVSAGLHFQSVVAGLRAKEEGAKAHKRRLPR